MPGYLTDPVANAAGISISASGNISAPNVQGAIYELDSEKAPATGIAQSAITNLVSDLASKAPSTNIAQSAITNLVSDLGSKAPSASPTFTGFVNTPIIRTDKWQNTSGSNIETILQVKEFKASPGDKTVSGGSFVTLASGTITTQQNSKILMTYYSAQMILGSSDTNPEIFLRVDGNDQGGLDTDHIFYGSNAFRPFIVVSVLSNSVSAGSHTVAAVGSAYNTGRSVTYDYQSSGSPTRIGRLMVMEIAQ